MNKTIKNIFTYLVIFLSITQIINYLYNNIYGSLIFFLVLAIGLYLITNKNITVSLLITIIITNILNVSDVLDNNLFQDIKEGRRDMKKRRILNKTQDKVNAKAKRSQQIEEARNENILKVLRNQIKQLYTEMQTTRLAIENGQNEIEETQEKLKTRKKEQHLLTGDVKSTEARLRIKDDDIYNIEKRLKELIDNNRENSVNLDNLQTSYNDLLKQKEDMESSMTSTTPQMQSSDTYTTPPIESLQAPRIRPGRQ